MQTPGCIPSLVDGGHLIIKSSHEKRGVIDQESPYIRQ